MNLIPTLSADEATTMLEAALAAARAAGVAVTVGVVDAGGALLVLIRMDGARAYTVDLATRKARTSAAIGISTAMLETMYAGKPSPAEVMTIPGGIPVLHDTGCAGAIGVSGATTQLDEAIAKAGLAALIAA